MISLVLNLLATQFPVLHFEDMGSLVHSLLKIHQILKLRDNVLLFVATLDESIALVANCSILEGPSHGFNGDSLFSHLLDGIGLLLGHDEPLGDDRDQQREQEGASHC